MPVKASERLGITEGALEEFGAFDPVLDVDTRLFIDPALVRACEVGEFRTAGATVEKRFIDVMKLLAESKLRGDAFWRAAERLFTFPELKGLCIGYADRRGTSGSGMGDRLRSQILVTAKAIVDTGIRDPSFFELMGLLEKNVGADRISDMLGGIVATEIAAYSQHVFDAVGVGDGRDLNIGDRTFLLPWNPFNDAPILLLPPLNPSRPAHRGELG